MELFKEILTNILKEEEINVIFPNLKMSAADFDCIEKIVCIFEKIGSSGGGRHDFG